MKLKKSITSDLFAIDPCDDCNGEGQIEVAENITKDISYLKLEDCDICNGTGIIQ